MDEISCLIMNKLMTLAADRQQPLIFLENPLFDDGTTGQKPILAQIGDASTTFDGFFPNDLIELYASLKGQLEAIDKKENVQSGAV